MLDVKSTKGRVKRTNGKNHKLHTFAFHPYFLLKAFCHTGLDNDNWFFTTSKIIKWSFSNFCLLKAVHFISINGYIIEFEFSCKCWYNSLESTFESNILARNCVNAGGQIIFCLRKSRYDDVIVMPLYRSKISVMSFYFGLKNHDSFLLSCVILIVRLTSDMMLIDLILYVNVHQSIIT